MLIEVKETHPPKAGGKVAHVIAADGKKYEIWPDKLAQFHVGKPYECEVAEREYNGRPIWSIKKATPANGAAPPVNGAAAPGRPSLSGEGEYVGHVVSALILKGEIVDKQIASATARLRQIWRKTDPGQQYQEAAE